MLISEMSLEKLTKAQITDLVFGMESEIDDGTLSGDCIFVFGGTSMERTDKAVALFNDARAPYILFTGGDRYGTRTDREALVLRDRAIELGVPKESTMVETSSNNTIENILCSLVILDRKLGLHSIRRLLLVSQQWHMRRCMLMFRTFLPSWVDLVWCPEDRLVASRDNWWKEPEWERRVMNEAFKVVNGVQDRYFIDADIPI
ncbi:YdcF family protein [Alicyclobacillus fastidiosus]|uniref:YdcF family protein n=1 Tax=Alicyclobacillus fastidiosus TaxID=392011 RepID=A0ABV5AI09_9BACL|nr:YdcF family protein [Alicyclobacillus fastidiosus]WEH10104.1 YdcF family protein [Alicyclobacillus fastidiosus]